MNDPFEDDPFEDDEEPSASGLATAPPATDIYEDKRATQKREEAELSEAELSKYARRDQARDLALWSEELPDPKMEARYYGNLALRLVKGITRSEIKKMTIRDRVSAAGMCFDRRRTLMNEPTQHINISARQTIHEMLPALKEELARRERQRKTIDITLGGTA